MADNKFDIRLNRLRYPRTANEWDSFLQKYGYGIWEFSFCIAGIIRMVEFKYTFSPDTKFAPMMKYGRREYYEILGNRINKMKKLKEIIINKLNAYLVDFGYRQEEKLSQGRIDHIVKIFELEQFFYVLDEETNGLEKDVMKVKQIWRKRGHPVETRYLIASIWAQVMKDKRGINWRMILLLMDWFFDNLSDAIYSSILGKPEDFLEYNKFEKEYHVIKRDKKRKEHIDMLSKAYFPKPRRKRFRKIDFKKDYINVGGLYLDNEHPLITFPNGVTFP